MMGSVAALAPGKDPMGLWGWDWEQGSLLGETRGSLIQMETGAWDSGCGCRSPSLSWGVPKAWVPSRCTTRVEPMWILLQLTAKGDPDTIRVWEWKGLALCWSKGLKWDFSPSPHPFFFKFIWQWLCPPLVANFLPV